MKQLIIGCVVACVALIGTACFAQQERSVIVPPANQSATYVQDGIVLEASPVVQQESASPQTGSVVEGGDVVVDSNVQPVPLQSELSQPMASSVIPACCCPQNRGLFGNRYGMGMRVWSFRGFGMRRYGRY